MFVSKAGFSAVFLSLTASTAFAGASGPVKSVTLSSGGLAEIVRSATVGQNAEINIDVPLDQVDDILKSIVVRDEKGHVKSLSLAGPTPVDETFKALPFKPSDLTSLPALLNSIKGSRIQAGEQQGVVLGVIEIPGNAQTPLSWQLSFLRDDGAIAMLADNDIAQKIFLHVNNSNPALLPESSERATLEKSGWRLAYDGMEVTL